MSIEAQLPPTVMWLAFLIIYSLYPDSQLNYFFALCSGKSYAVPLFGMYRQDPSVMMNNADGHSRSELQISSPYRPDWLGDKIKE